MANNELKNIERFRSTAEAICALYEAKNRAYGNSFGKTFGQLGIISAVTRISDKFNRLVSLTTTNADNLGESTIDTLKDLAAYAIMTICELEKEERRIEPIQEYATSNHDAILRREVTRNLSME